MYVMNILLDIVCLQLFLGLGELQPEGTMIQVYIHTLLTYILDISTHTFWVGHLVEHWTIKMGSSHILDTCSSSITLSINNCRL